MRVLLAETAGFCMGVDMALNRLDTQVDAEAGGELFTLGPIIHNPQVLERYAAKGVRVADSDEDIPPGAAVVIRAHGVPRQVEESLHERGARVVDATCPRVKKAQVLIRRNVERGRRLLLYGEQDHPEVCGLLSYAGDDAVVFADREEFDALVLEPGVGYVLAAQTTQDREEFDAMAEELLAREDRDVEVLHTICDATRMCQMEAVDIAKRADAMVVVGGRNSGNTRRLALVAGQHTPTVHVETVDELPLDELRGKAVIGLTAGASTPSDLVDAVRRALEAL